MLGVVVISLVSSSQAAECGLWSEPELTGELSGGPTESSGLAASRTRDGVWFTHDDKGGEPVLTAFRLDGTLVGQHQVKNATNVDWEDLAAAPCPDVGDCLYIGDIGDNDGTRSELTVYAVPEPADGDDNVKATFRWVGLYPDGPHDSEALMVHPCTGRIHVVTKDSDGASGVYRFPVAPEDRDVVELERIAVLSIDGPVATAREVTGGDWGPDGEVVVLRTGSQLLEWVTDPASPNQHWTDTPTVLAGGDELQGEAVAYGVDGTLVTTSEGAPMVVRTRVCDDPLPAQGDCVFPQTGRQCGCVVDAAGPSGWAGLAVSLVLLARRRHGPPVRPTGAP